MDGQVGAPSLLEGETVGLLYGRDVLGPGEPVSDTLGSVLAQAPHKGGIGQQSDQRLCKGSRIAGLKATRQVLNLLKGQPQLYAPGVEAEERLIERETSAIVERTLELGQGDLAVGVVRAFEGGVLDVPFAPSRMAAGAVMPARDLAGAIRMLEFGKLPLDDETKAFHREALAERAKAQGREVSFQMVTDDIYAVSKGRLVGTSARSGRSG